MTMHRKAYVWGHVLQSAVRFPPCRQRAGKLGGGSGSDAFHSYNAPSFRGDTCLSAQFGHRDILSSVLLNLLNQNNNS